ncbi:MAG: fibronectin type III domain-containing protein [Chitinophagaceae bacterium]
MAGGLSFRIVNGPAFATFTDNGDKTATLTLTPALKDAGVYNNIRIIVNDQNGGADTTTFNLTVNDNYDPVIDNIEDYTLDENETLTINLTATDQNPADVLSWSVNNVPAVYTLVPVTNGAASLVLHPGFAAAGIYEVTVNVTDGMGGTATRTFTLTVNDRDPNTKIYTRVKYANEVGAPWNNLNGPITTDLKDEHGVTTTVGVKFQPEWWLPYNAGPSTGNNSGVYPDAILNDFWYFGYYGGPETANVLVTGLDPAKKYSLSFYAGSSFNAVQDNGTTNYTVGTKTVSLDVQGNTENTVSISDISPASDGTITVNMTKGPNTPIGYLNALVITTMFNDGTAPVVPTTLVAEYQSGQGAELSWQDIAYNESSYEVYRSTSANGTYTKIGTTAANTDNYTDNAISGSTAYFYKVRGVNDYGVSGYSNIATITTANRIPELTAISDVVLKNNQTSVVNVTAVDDATDHITLTVDGLPSFATFTDNGNGTGVINVKPVAGSVGVYTGITVTATDNSDSSRSTNFAIFVTDASLSSVYVNMTDYISQAPTPWNNMSIAYLPVAGSTITGLKDDGNVNTGIAVTLTDAWQGISTSGMKRRNGSELYPEEVSNSGIYFTDNATHRVTISGLSPSKKYNFVFFSSHNTSESTLTNFAIGSQTVSLNGCHNSNKTVQLNGIVPPANGQIIINVTKNASALSGLLSSLVIQSYTPGVVSVFGPSDLRVLDYNATNAISLQWQDRADNETGYEVWRAADGGAFTLLTTLGANVTSYTNTGLTANTYYNYKVRAKNGTTYSAYSNALRAHTYATTVFININTDYAAASPWNNLNWIYTVGGAVWNNFKNDAGVATNIGMVQPVRIDGMVIPGVNTGNNSGVFPDNVLAESFGLFPGITSYLKLTGLNLSKTYDITVTASITGIYGDNTTAYTINGRTYLLNSIMNKDGTLTMFDIVPDQNGEVNISFTGAPGATYGLLGAIVIKGYDAYQPAVVASREASSSATEEVITMQPEKAAVVAEEKLMTAVQAYPNPFDQFITVNVPAEANENVKVELVDMSGHVVYQRQYTLSRGNNTLRLEPGNITTGVYVLRVVNSEKGKQSVIRLLKQR